MKVIYKKSNLKCVGTLTESMTAQQEIEINVIPNFGGTIDDYDVIETDLKYFELIRESGAVKAVEKIPEVLPEEPTTEERLQMAEDTILFLLMGGM